MKTMAEINLLDRLPKGKRKVEARAHAKTEEHIRISRETVKKLAGCVAIVERGTDHAEFVNGENPVVDQRLLDDVKAESAGIE